MRPRHYQRALLFIHLLAAFGLALLAERAQAEVEPYAASVSVPRALVYSGPSEKFYATAALTAGESVDVYRERAGGWLGVRPTNDSFSWIPKRHLKLKEGNLAEVTEADVPSRIGSLLNDKRNAVQVQLKRGEMVEVIGSESIHGEVWCKIAPPAGEFRWVQSSNVERVGPLAEAMPKTEADAPVVAASATAATAAAPPATSVEQGKVAIKPDAGTTTAATSPAPSTSPPAGGDAWRAPLAGAAPFTPTGVPTNELAAPPLAPLTPITPTTTTAPPSTGAASTPATVPASANTATPAAATSISPATTPSPAAAAPPAAASLPVTPTDLPRQLTDIELRLSRMASASPQLWNTTRLQRDAEQLLAQAKTQPERDMVKATMLKIDQFTNLARRYQQAPATVAAAGAPTAPLGVQLGQASDAGRYDAVGVLKPVVSKRPGAPQFALVDERGQVVTFVTPSPDCNLQPYLGRRVGIAGNRGFIPEFNRANVVAGRVTPLSEKLVR